MMCLNKGNDLKNGGERRQYPMTALRIPVHHNTGMAPGDK
jgi:hypothetical protein